MWAIISKFTVYTARKFHVKSSARTGVISYSSASWPWPFQTHLCKEMVLARYFHPQRYFHCSKHSYNRDKDQNSIIKIVSFNLDINSNTFGVFNKNLQKFIQHKCPFTNEIFILPKILLNFRKRCSYSEERLCMYCNSLTGETSLNFDRFNLPELINKCNPVINESLAYLKINSIIQYFEQLAKVRANLCKTKTKLAAIDLTIKQNKNVSSNKVSLDEIKQELKSQQQVLDTMLPKLFVKGFFELCTLSLFDISSSIEIIGNIMNIAVAANVLGAAIAILINHNLWLDIQTNLKKVN